MIIASIYPCPFDVQERHDLSAAIIKDGVVYAYEEDKLTNVKHENTVKFPERSLMMGFKELNILPSAVDKWVFPTPSRPVELKDQYLFFSWRFKAFKGTFEEFPAWFRANVHFVDHQIAHAANAVITSGFEECAFLCQDGGGDLGDNRDMIFGEYKDGEYHVKREHRGINTICSFHAFLTDSLGISGGDNGKTSGLAAYGEVQDELGKEYSGLLAVRENGIDFARKRYGITEVNLKKIRPDEYETGKIFYHFPSDTNLLRLSLGYLQKDIAATGEHILRSTFLELVKRLRKETRLNKIVLSGGLFQNVALNNAILESKLFDEIFIPMGPSDAGLSLGQALYIDRKFAIRKTQRMLTPYIGPSYSQSEIQKLLDRFRLNYCFERDVAKRAAELIAQGKIVGWFQGKGEFGPRSLGNRSILADPRTMSSKTRVNQFLKKRDWFMPYAPSIQEEYLDEWVELPQKSPYMQIAFTVKNSKRPLIPAAVHVDGTSRFHVLSREDNEKYWNLIEHFRRITGLPLVLNTSFNRHGIATISTPRQAVEHLLEGCMDYLAIDDFLIDLTENRIVSDLVMEEKDEDVLLREDCIAWLTDVFTHGSPQQITDYLGRLSSFLAIPVGLEGEHLKISDSGVFSLEDGQRELVRRVNAGTCHHV